LRAFWRFITQLPATGLGVFDGGSLEHSAGTKARQLANQLSAKQRGRSRASQAQPGPKFDTERGRTPKHPHFLFLSQREEGRPHARDQTFHQRPERHAPWCRH
jgi:hypothetical protein